MVGSSKSKGEVMKKIAALVVVLALSACGATTTIRMPDGSEHVCQHYIDGIVMWDGDTTDGSLKELCQHLGVARMN